MSADPKKFYLTTPIYYVNARPHIGHAYTDHRRRRSRLPPTLSSATTPSSSPALTSTPEDRTLAAAAGIPATIPRPGRRLSSSPSGIAWASPTTNSSAPHRPQNTSGRRPATWRWNSALRGFIYLGSYTGSYCVSDEAFVDAPSRHHRPRLRPPPRDRHRRKLLLQALLNSNLPLLDLIESDTLPIEN